MADPCMQRPTQQAKLSLLRSFISVTTIHHFVENLQCHSASRKPLPQNKCRDPKHTTALSQRPELSALRPLVEGVTPHTLFALCTDPEAHNTSKTTSKLPAAMRSDDVSACHCPFICLAGRHAQNCAQTAQWAGVSSFRVSAGSGWTF